MSFRAAFALVFTSLSLGCAVESPSSADDEFTGVDSEEVKSTGDTFVSVKRDFRKCAYPMCGGFHVTSLEDDLMRCADGKSARTCYVAELDLGSLEPVRGTIVDGIHEGAVILSGRTTNRKKISTFVTAKAWLAPAPGPATGSYFLVTKKTETTHWALRLGLTRRRAFDAIDLAAAPGTDADWDALNAASRSSDGPIVAGTITKVKILEATQFWLPVSAKPVVTCGPALDTKIATAASGLLWPSESDYPVESWSRAGAAKTTPLTVAQFRALLATPASTPIEARTFESVMDARTQIADWMDEGQIATATQFQALRKVLESNLTNLQVFRVGTVSIEVYVVGRSACGDLVGVKSTVIET